MDSLKVEDVFIVKVVGYEFKARWGPVLPRMVLLTIPELNADHGFDPVREGADVCQYFGWPLLEILESSTGGGKSLCTGCILLRNMQQNGY